MKRALFPSVAWPSLGRHPLTWHFHNLLRVTGLRQPGAREVLRRALDDRIDANGPVDLNYRFLFVAGTSGSGTTMVTRILSRLPGAVCLGGKYSTVDPADETVALPAEFFNKAITRLWDRQAPTAQTDHARRTLPHAIAALREVPAYRKADPIVYKRSSPFNPGDRFRPDLSDITAVWPDGRIILIYRDPRAAAASAYRRGYAPTLHAAAIICEEQLTYLAAQLATLPPERYHILAYDRFCLAPGSFVAGLAAFVGFASAAVAAAIAAEGIKTAPLTRWQQELAPEQLAFLDRHFDARRRRQWTLLTTGDDYA